MMSLLRSETILSVLLGAFLGGISTFLATVFLDKINEKKEVSRYMVAVAHESCAYGNVYNLMSAEIKKDPTFVYVMKDLEPEEIVVSSAPAEIFHLSAVDFNMVSFLKSFNGMLNAQSKLITDSFKESDKSCDKCMRDASISFANNIAKYSEELKAQSNIIYKRYDNKIKCL